MPKVIVTFMFDTETTEIIYQDTIGQKPRVALRWLQDYAIASEVGKTLQQKEKEKSDKEGDQRPETAENTSLLAQHDQSPTSKE